MSFLASRLSRGTYPGGYRTLWYWLHSTLFALGGVGTTWNLTGTRTVERRSVVSSGPGGDNTVNVMTPEATPSDVDADFFTRA